MPRSPNSFTKALSDAEKRLAKALNERAMAQEKMNELAMEIPALQQTISALQVQTGRLPPAKYAHVSEVAFLSVEQLEALKQQPVRAGVVMDEDDLLPDVDGTPLVPEE